MSDKPSITALRRAAHESFDDAKYAEHLTVYTAALVGYFPDEIADALGMQYHHAVELTAGTRCSQNRGIDHGFMQDSRAVLDLARKQTAADAATPDPGKEAETK